MTFKKLNLDRSKIDEVIQEWASLDQKPEPQKKGTGYHYRIKKDGSEVLLIIYLNHDGTTSLNPTAGKNRDASIDLANYIKEKCLIAERKNFSLSFKSVPEEDFSLLLDFLCNDLDAEIILDEPSSTGRLLKIKGPSDDEITVTYYNTKTVHVQGKPLNLYVEVKLFFYEILSFEQVVKHEAETYKIDLDVDDIKNELLAYLPTAFSFLDEKLVKIITPALSLIKLEIPLEDYSSFVFPALKGLEGYIRQLLRHKGNEDGVKKVGRIGSLFIKGANKCFLLQDFAKSDIACDVTCNALEKAYSFWMPRRHPYFHVDKHISMTPIIYNKKDAETIVHETLTLIEETYSKIKLK